MMTKAKYIGPRDPDYRFGEVYEIRRIKGVSDKQAIAARSIYGDFYAMPAELFAPVDFVQERPKIFITKSQKEALLSVLPAAADLISADKLEGLLCLIKRRVSALNDVDDPNDKQRATKEKLQILYHQLFDQN